MKKKMIFGLAVATIALLPSCSNDETVDVPSGKPIEFSGTFVDKSTRTTDPSYTTDNLSEFRVYGWAAKGTDKQQVFDEVAISHVVSTPFYHVDNPYWTYSGTQYWIPGASYTFSALAGYQKTAYTSDWKAYQEYNGELTMNDNGERVATPKITGFKSDGVTDLIYSEATATGYSTGNDPVSFTFQHQLAKVRFSFQNNTNPYSNIDAKVTNIQLVDPIESGDVELSSMQYGAVWSNQQKAAAGEATPLKFGNAYEEDGYLPLFTSENKDEDPYSVCDYERLVIPADETQTYKVTFHVTIYLNKIQATEFDSEATIKDVAFKPGYAYNFKAVLNETAIDGAAGLNPIVFDGITVTSWTEADSNDDVWDRFTDDSKKSTSNGDGNSTSDGGTGTSSDNGTGTSEGTGTSDGTNALGGGTGILGGGTLGSGIHGR